VPTFINRGVKRKQSFKRYNSSDTDIVVGLGQLDIKAAYKDDVEITRKKPIIILPAVIDEESISVSHSLDSPDHKLLHTPNQSCSSKYSSSKPPSPSSYRHQSSADNPQNIAGKSATMSPTSSNLVNIKPKKLDVFARLV